MTHGFVLLWMFMMHIVDDYYLQGVLAKMKQKSWWKDNAPQDMYKNDYVMALLMHSFSWAFMIMLPLAVFLNFDICILFLVVLLCNVVTHCIVDDQKANKKTINLVEDQLIHLGQIVITFCIVMCYYNS